MKDLIITICLILANLLLMQLIALINSSLGQFGVILYLPCILLFPTTANLEQIQAIIVLTITGFCLDYHYHSLLGFHVFVLILCFLLTKELINNKRLGKLAGPNFIQLIANIFSGSLLFLTLLFNQTYLEQWSILNFLVDLIISTLALFFIGPWYNVFCRELLSIVTCILEKQEQNP